MNPATVGLAAGAVAGFAVEAVSQALSGTFDPVALGSATVKGAATGFFGGLAAMGVKSLSISSTVAETAAASVATGTVAAAAQAVDNAIHGRPALDGVATAGLTAAVTQGIAKGSGLAETVEGAVKSGAVSVGVGKTAGEIAARSASSIGKTGLESLGSFFGFSNDDQTTQAPTEDGSSSPSSPSEAPGSSEVDVDAGATGEIH